jgi:ethanolamine permease
VGACEAIQTIFYVAAAVIPFGQMLTLALGAPKAYEPVYWVFFFVTAFFINYKGRHVFWKFSSVIGFASLVLVLLYILGTIPNMDFDKHAEADKERYDIDGGEFLSSVMRGFPLASWFYIGVEALPLACLDCEKVICCNVDVFPT